MNLNIARTIGFYIAAVSLLSIAAWTLSMVASSGPAVPAPTCPPVEEYMTNPVEDELCGRYHLRKRTNRFFRRSVV